MPDNKTPQTEAQTLELLNASITRETVRGAVENFLGASKDAAKQDAGRAPFNELAYARRVAADPSTSDNEEFGIDTIRALVAEIDRLSASPVAGQNAITFESGDLDTVEFWTRAANRACEMLTQRTAERDALKAREELAQTSLRLLTTALKLQNERAEKAERAVRELRDLTGAASRAADIALDRACSAMEDVDEAREEAAESRRHAAVSDAGPANDVALKVTE